MNHMQTDINEQSKIDAYLEKCNYAKKMLESQIEIMIKDFTFNHGYNPVEHVKGRIKTEKSIREKLAKHNKEYTAENIEKYVSSFYDTHNSKYREAERER